ncbi:MGMT family protein [Vibrio tritonius]|uniref:MGMT family protein n=1 Tax=Vibrio tritonius TaxID=1435069 RepID=A0ABS7YIV4_9VIBR|nr:MGMT family protein [Vibrio tritonius]MCA2015614.1 MGMT family protein [Vibrio tritonius]
MDQFLAQIFYVIDRIPEGSITTYGEVARMAGFPGYARHVGKALSQLPEGSKLPWHRVVNSQGRISLKGDDLLRQKRKLTAEGIEVSQEGKIKLRQYRWNPEQE